ncbi:SLC13 family permease [Rheinheimera baltica]|uniref:SLC13 family permease n=1 Tax=Rheinheimera baltica TaxID=67576 RepID=UPI0003F51BF8|nr:DASS family sodium-coupled anion symporter [Rheinheimera baltica]
MMQPNWQWLARVAGPGALLFTMLTDAPQGMTEQAWLTSGLAVWMAVWWISETVAIAVTALLPLVLAPLLGLTSIKEASAPYAHPLIFLFLGGFILSIAMERWSLHKRIALTTMLMAGSKPSQQIAAVMAVTAFLSMWMSNTATAVMMLPIGLSVCQMVQAGNNGSFAKALLLAIAYAASIGGLATLIGTPPNALLAAYLNETYQLNIGFAQWMLFGVPLTLVLIVFAWFWLTRVMYKLDQSGTLCAKAALLQQRNALGPISQAEKTVALVFVTTALAWIFRPVLVSVTGLAIDDTMIAVIAAVVLFMLPSGQMKQPILQWEDTQKLPWGILLLFGGGLSLAALMSSSGLAAYISQQVSSFDTLPLWLMVVLVTAVIIFLTEVTSNTATAAGFLPLLGPVALSLSGSPLTLVIPAAIAASCAFMMPVATPPNAIVFSSGELKIIDMAKAGLALNIFAIIIISALTLTLGKAVFGF